MDIQASLDKISNFDPNDIDWSNMGSWPLVGRVVFAFMFFVALMAAAYFFSIQELSDKFDRTIAQETSLKKELETKAFRVANLDAFKQQLADIEESFGSLLRQLPRDTEVAGLLEDITSSALGANLQIRSIKLDKESETEFYTELPINIDVEGEYHDFGAFVSAVAGLGRIVTLHDFTVASSSENSNRLNLKIVAKTYRYNDEVKKSKKKKKGKR
ncbi:type 4a pilus biogenesis protein PilO [Oceaniserpentilla sp. 4NH20-0058]|uniref:type 4a pilus biogenesis protein PilO n=1 Tax=Oceaniserpentilla sp. 4NH20-0058 TaxID=3127660 RepID=UPI00310AC900